MAAHDSRSVRVRPSGHLDEALRILKDREGEAKVLSGGYSLLPLVKLRLAQPGLLVDIQAIGGLDGIAEDATTGCGSAAGRRIARSRGPSIVRAVRDARATSPAASATRRSGTGGRSAAPSPTRTRLGLAGGAARARTPRSSAAARRRARDPGPGLLPRHVHDRDRAHRDPDRGPDPRAGRGHRGAYAEARATGRRLRDGRRLDDRPPGRRRAIGHAGVGVTGVVGLAVRGDRRRGGCSSGRSPGEDVFRAAGGPPRRASQPVSDVQGPEDYKRAMVAEMTVRALRAATERALAFNG